MKDSQDLEYQDLNNDLIEIKNSLENNELIKSYHINLFDDQKKESGIITYKTNFNLLGQEKFEKNRLYKIFLKFKRFEINNKQLIISDEDLKILKNNDKLDNFKISKKEKCPIYPLKENINFEKLFKDSEYKNVDEILEIRENYKRYYNEISNINNDFEIPFELITNLLKVKKSLEKYSELYNFNLFCQDKEYIIPYYKDKNNYYKGYQNKTQYILNS